MKRKKLPIVKTADFKSRIAAIMRAKEGLPPLGDADDASLFYRPPAKLPPIYRTPDMAAFWPPKI